RNQRPALSPNPSRFRLVLADQNFVRPFERSKLPGVPLVTSLDAEKIQEHVQVLSVIRAGTGGVVIQVVVVILHQDFQDDLQEPNDLQTAWLHPLSLDVINKLDRMKRIGILAQEIKERLDAAAQNPAKIGEGHK